MLYLLYLIKVRYVVRMKYKIPSARWPCCCCCRGCCTSGICEDICCAVICPFCTVSQLSRQTGVYDTNKASFCTRDGLRHNNNCHHHPNHYQQHRYPARSYPVQV
jgi:hypothetical protein